jgi:hypothetical protein
LGVGAVDCGALFFRQAHGGAFRSVK